MEGMFEYIMSTRIKTTPNCATSSRKDLMGPTGAADEGVARVDPVAHAVFSPPSVFPSAHICW